MAIIAISDTHLGSKNSNQAEFCDFLEWVSGLDAKPEGELVEGVPSRIMLYEYGKEASTEEYAGNTLSIKSPDKLILLGDILELWDPIHDDRNNAAKEALKVFSLLQSLKCKKIYVSGNHDEDINELAEVMDKKGSKNIRLAEDFEIYKRHYPKEKKTRGEEKVQGLEIGEGSYFFMHGHQFDKFQITKWVSDKLKVRFDPIDWMQDLSNVSFTRKILREVRPTAFFLLVLLLFIAWSYFLREIVIFSKTALLWAFSSFFIIVSSLPRICTYLQTKIWERIRKPKGRRVLEVLKEGYYRLKKDKIGANVVVFGHTHLADLVFLENEKKFFCNTGHWTSEEMKNDIYGSNNFVYIDENGIYLMKWKGENRVECCNSTRI